MLIWYSSHKDRRKEYALNFIHNRRWFDNEFDHAPAAEAMYIEELRAFKKYLMERTSVSELRSLNLLGVQFALCEASKYFFYLRYESGSIYKPASRDIELILKAVNDSDAARLRAIWEYWEQDDAEESGGVDDDQFHPDHLVVH